jgi:HSP90 family molecular chaperone
MNGQTEPKSLIFFHIPVDTTLLGLEQFIAATALQWTSTRFFVRRESTDLQQLNDHSGHKLICITKTNCEIAETDEEKKGFGDLKTKLEPICNEIKHILGMDYKKVIFSKRLIVKPCTRFVDAQAVRDSSMPSYMQPKNT